MSRRITFTSKITDCDIAVKTLKSLSIDHTVNGKHISLKSGKLKGAFIDLNTGSVQGDTDWHTKGDLGSLNQPYEEQNFLTQAEAEGVAIESRTVLANGDIVILCRMHG